MGISAFYLANTVRAVGSGCSDLKSEWTPGECTLASRSDESDQHVGRLEWALGGGTGTWVGPGVADIDGTSRLIHAPLKVRMQSPSSAVFFRPDGSVQPIGLFPTYEK